MGVKGSGFGRLEDREDEIVEAGGDVIAGDAVGVDVSAEGVEDVGVGFFGAEAVEGVGFGGGGGVQFEDEVAVGAGHGDEEVSLADEVGGEGAGAVGGEVEAVFFEDLDGEGAGGSAGGGEDTGGGEGPAVEVFAAVGHEEFGHGGAAGVAGADEKDGFGCVSGHGGSLSGLREGSSIRVVRFGGGAAQLAAALKARSPASPRPGTM